MNKKLFAILLALIMVLSLSTGLFAATPWDGSIDTSWYNTEDTSFELKDAKQLAGFAAIVNGTATGIKTDSFAGKTLSLTADVDLGGVKKSAGKVDGMTYIPSVWEGQKWTPIGKYTWSDYFQGTFDGKGHTISNLYVNSTSGNAGLFLSIGGSGVVKDLNLKDGFVTSTNTYSPHGALAGQVDAGAAVYHCTSNVEVNTKSYSGTGMVGRNSGIMAYCSNSGTMYSTSSAVGGVAGQSYGGKFVACFNSGLVKGSGSIGGIVGSQSSGPVSIVNCYNVGEINGFSSRGCNAGGIIGNSGSDANLLVNCYSAGKLTNRDADGVQSVKTVGALIGGTKGASTNSLYLAAGDIKGLGSSSNGSSDIFGMSGVTADALKGSAAALGSAYTADSSNINNGYPILTWQKDGKYSTELKEAEGLDIAQIKDATNKGFTVVMSDLLYYSVLNRSDFTVEAMVNGAKAEIKSLSGSYTLLEQNGKMVSAFVFTFDNMKPESDIVYSVKYKENEVKTYSFRSPETDQWYDYVADSVPGTGTKDDPYKISTPQQFAYFARYAPSDNYIDKYVVLANDIDMGAKYWTPFTFKGNFDGQNYSLINLKINDTKGSYFNGGSGLFSSIPMSSSSWSGYHVSYISNLHFVNPDVKGTSCTGILAGKICDTFVENCTVTGGKVSTNDTNTHAGGLVGCIDSNEDMKTVIRRCSVDLDMTAHGAAGGLVGYLDHGNNSYGSAYILDCKVSGNITSDYANGGYLGGFIGDVWRQQGVVMENCYSDAVVSGVGFNSGGFIGKVHVSGNANQYIGPDGITIKNSVALNPSVKTTRANGKVGRIVSDADDIVGASKGHFDNNYALDTMEVAGNLSMDLGGTGTDVTKAEAETKEFWASKVGFDFSENGAWIWDDTQKKPVLNHDKKAEIKVVIDRQPADATAYRNQPALFGVVPSGGTMNYNYQWESSTDGKTWKAVENGTEQSLSLTVDGGYTGGTLFRCVITDSAGFTATSDSAKLSVVLAKYTPKDAAKALKNYYAQKGTIDTAREAFAAKDLLGDISDLTVNLPYSSTYKSSSSSDYERYFTPYWIFMDSYALGNDPHQYTRVDGGLVEVVDAYRWIFEEQNRETGAAGKLSYGDAGAHYMPSFITAMEMYFQGQPWGNETAGTKLGRDGAIEYTFTQLVDHECGGKTYGTLKKTYTREDFNDLLAQSEFVILMARLSDDPVYGEQAKEAMSDVLKTMEYLYEETTVLNKYVETFGFYTSALFAAADATDSYFEKTAYLDMAQKVITEKIMPSVAADGGYSKEVGKQDISGDPYATAAVAMALGDYTKEKSYLSTFVYELSDASAVSQDLAAIDLGTLIVGDLDLPTKGVYGSTFTWESSDNNIIDAKTGKVVRSATDQPVTLTVTAVKGDETASRIISVTVKANADGNTDNVDAVLSGLQIPFMAISDIEMPGSSIEGVSLTWASSNPDALTAEGKVTRPAIGAEDATVTLTATVSQGDVTKTKDFSVTVYAQTNDSLKEGYYLTQSKYLKNRAINGYWAIYAAYAALGDYIADPANGYTFILSSPQANWYGVQYGATVMGICAMGENPYNYNGENWVQKLNDNFGGPYAGGLYSALGMEAAGANSTMYTAKGDYQVSQLSESSMAMGIDIAGWAAVLVAKHHDFPGYEESNTAALKAWLNYLRGLGIDTDGNFVGCNDISTGCAVTAFAALYSIGITDADPALDTWKNAATGKGIIDAIYEQGLVQDKIPGYMTQMEMAICDMYNAKYNGSTSTWIKCGVTKAKLDAQIEKAKAILADETKYEASSIKDIKAAMEKVNAISEERLNNKIADYGEEYYTLYDAVRYAKLAGQSEMDQAAADKVAEQINALNDEITLADKEAVAAAKAAYDALTNDQKALVAEDVKAKLTAAVDTIASLEQAEADKEAAANVINEINKINENVTLDDQSAVAAARAAYDALTKEQKALVTNLDKLTKAEGTIKELIEKDNGKVKNMTDVIEGQWYYDDVAYALDNNLFKGTSDTTFSPNQAMTRAMFVTVLGRNAGVEDSSASYPSTSVFDDVANDAYYASHVKWAVENGITVGVSKTEFAPNAKISRQDMATMMLRYAKAMGIRLPEMSKEAFGDDADIAVYAKEAVYKLKAVEIINGKDGNIFDPKGSTTRAEVAAVLHRFLTYKYEDFVKVDDTGCVIVDIEKFTLGQGFIMEPTVVKWEEGDTVADVLLRVAEEKGIELEYGDTDKGFYLSAIRDNETGEINMPQYLKDAAAEKGFTIGGRANADWLSQFDYTTDSGWMIWVNHEEIDKSAGVWPVTPGTVMRWQYTVCGYGRDLGSGKFEAPYVTVGNKDALVHAMAIASKHEKAGKAYENAMKVMEKMDATQAEIDAATEALND